MNSWRTFALCSSLALAAPALAADESPSAASIIERYGLEEAKTPVRERAGWRKPQRILVPDFLPKLPPLVQATWPDAEVIVASREDAAQKAANVDVVIALCTPEVIAAGKSVQWIHMLSAGVEECVSIPAVRERNILVTNMRRLAGPIIAEHALALMLAFTRGLDIYVPAQSRREWKPATPPGRVTAVNGKTLLVVGLGGIGEEVAKRAHAFGMRVIAIRASGRSGPDYVSYVGLPDELTKLASQADFVVDALPLTPSTAGMFNAAFFASMKPSGFFVNVGRGGTVVTDALVAALRENKIGGAGLDVVDPEPLPADHPLWSAPNVIITPHVAAQSNLGSEGYYVVIEENLRRYAAGERMLSVVDVGRGY